MATFVLVHGAFHGGWCWQRVTHRLRAAGHDVYAPTLTGLGERVHLAHPDISLDTHIQDVVNVFVFEELTDVILVGHSYGGMVITGVADRLPERVIHLVYLDAFVPENGESGFSYSSDESAAALREQVERDGQGWLLPAPTAAEMGVIDPADAAWVDARLTPLPIHCIDQPLKLHRSRDTHIVRTYIRCLPMALLELQVARIHMQPGWSYYEIDTGHDAMVTAPNTLTELLLNRT